MKATCDNCDRSFTKSLADDSNCCPYCRLLQLNPMNPADWDKDPDPVWTVDHLQELFPELEILRFHQAGGMGEVFAVRQKSLDRPAALKVLRSEIAEDEESRERFQREARSMAELDHTNIVSIYDFGDRDGKCLYLLMEFVEGRNLGEILEEGTPNLEQALGLISQISQAIQFAHSKNIIHRDIKPGNILVTPDYQAKITDFGLAKSIGPVTDYSLTRKEVGLGTPHYMAPEQLTNASEVDGKSDIFALGVLFYQVLTGSIPRGRYGVIRSKYPQFWLLEERILQALSDEPTHRPACALEFDTVATICRKKQARKSSLLPLLISLPILVAMAICILWATEADGSFSMSPPKIQPAALPVGNIRYWNPNLFGDRPFFLGEGPFSELSLSPFFARSVIAYHNDGSILSAFHPFEKKEVKMLTKSFKLDVDHNLTAIPGENNTREFSSDIFQEEIKELHGATGLEVFLTADRKVRVAATSRLWTEQGDILHKLETLENVKAISTCAESGVIVLENGEIVCWNFKSRKYCWNAKSGEFICNAPKKSGWRCAGCGKFHYTGIDSDGKIHTWLADPVNITPGKLTAVAIPEKAHGRKAVRVKTDASFSAVQFDDGSWCGWGDDSGQGLIEKIDEIGPTRDICFRTRPAKYTELYWITEETPESQQLARR